MRFSMATVFGQKIARPAFEGVAETRKSPHSAAVGSVSGRMPRSLRSRALMTRFVVTIRIL